MFIDAGLEINFNIHLLAGDKKEKFGHQIKNFWPKVPKN